MEKEIDVRQAEGEELDAAVARCQNVEFDEEGKPIWFNDAGQRVDYSPSTKWEQAGPIIESEMIANTRTLSGVWEAWSPAPLQPSGEAFAVASTILTAAMRCYVISERGESMTIPTRQDAEPEPKSFKVVARYTTYVETTVEADNLDEAWKIAQNADGALFENPQKDDWEIDSVVEVV